MAYDKGLPQLMRDDLDQESGISEKRMFGGLFRVGKPQHSLALTIDGVRTMNFTGRPMGGFVDAD
ncbi:hypothetical protein [Thalassovita sp.]|uniref:hypothetical protein n=1 Tax=Thalassovita sp. TaxID=1979401 RepID=UPI002B2653E6|nr:hypothetical protein [Thalassovita sp.]